ncbi:unnamed protein product [Parajaminaea phylloscopi]
MSPTNAADRSLDKDRREAVYTDPPAERHCGEAALLDAYNGHGGEAATAVTLPPSPTAALNEIKGAAAGVDKDDGSSDRPVTATSDQQDRREHNEEPREKKVSCLTCREAKVKCVTEEGESKCRRCVKLDVECRIEGHRRGRRKGKIKQHQVNRRFELIARTLEELRPLAKSLQDAPSIALIASMRYQLLSSTCINQETRDILHQFKSPGPQNHDVKGKKRARDAAEEEANTSSNDEAASTAGPSSVYTPAPDSAPASGGAMSMIGSDVQSRLLTSGPRAPPGAFSHSSGLLQHRGFTPDDGPSNIRTSASSPQVNADNAPSTALYPSRSGMMSRASVLAQTSQASRSTSLLVEIEDYESVAIVPQAVQTLSNPLKLLAHASDAVDSATRSGRLLSWGMSPEMKHEELPRLGNRSHSVEQSDRLSDGAHGTRRRSKSLRRTTRQGSERSNLASPSSPRRLSELHARIMMEDDELVPLHRRLNQSMDQREEAAWSHFVPHRELPAANVASNSPRHRNGSRAQSTPRLGKKALREEEKAEAERKGGQVEWSSYFSRGAFHPRYDSGASLDPIERGLLSVEQAHTLLSYFYDRFETFIYCFDPNLSTLSYLRKHSAFLVSVICYIAAEYHPDSEYYDVFRRLGNYVDEMLPAVMSGVYKSVEISQACYLLACYQQMADSAVDDQTWALLGTSLRIASELGCNLACFSSSAPEGDPAMEKHHRQLKNTERLWLSLWTFEKTIASQTGQKLHLAEDPIISACGTWHQRPYALQHDEALVAFVDLRRIMDRHATTFHTHVLRAMTTRETNGSSGDSVGPARSKVYSEQVMLLIDLFRANASIDFKRWEESWLAGYEQLDRPTSALQSTGVLHLHFANLVTLSLPLRSTSDMPSKDLDSLRRDCYSAAIGFLSAFIDRSRRNLLPCLPNTMTVSAVYCAIFALKLCSLSPDVTPYIDARRVVRLAHSLAEELRQAGSFPAHRAQTSVPARFADYLFAYLLRWESHYSPAGEGSLSFDAPEGRVPSVSHGHAGSTGARSGLTSTAADPRSRRRNDARLHRDLDHGGAMPPSLVALGDLSQDQHNMDLDMSREPPAGSFAHSHANFPPPWHGSSMVSGVAPHGPREVGVPSSHGAASSAMGHELDDFWQSIMTGGGVADSMNSFDALLDQMAGFSIPRAQPQGHAVPHGHTAPANGQPTVSVQQHAVPTPFCPYPQRDHPL